MTVPHHLQLPKITGAKSLGEVITLIRLWWAFRAVGEARG